MKVSKWFLIILTIILLGLAGFLLWWFKCKKKDIYKYKHKRVYPYQIPKQKEITSKILRNTPCIRADQRSAVIY